jgi:hypothetical protein
LFWPSSKVLVVGAAVVTDPNARPQQIIHIGAGDTYFAGILIGRHLKTPRSALRDTNQEAEP